MTAELVEALRLHKPLLLTVFATLTDYQRDRDWETVRAWLIDEEATQFSREMLAAAHRIGLAVREDEWPGAYAERFRTALRVRGLLQTLWHDEAREDISPKLATGAA